MGYPHGRRQGRAAPGAAMGADEAMGAGASPISLVRRSEERVNEEEK